MVIPVEATAEAMLSVPVLSAVLTAFVTVLLVASREVVNKFDIVPFATLILVRDSVPALTFAPIIFVA